MKTNAIRLWAVTLGLVLLTGCSKDPVIQGGRTAPVPDAQVELSLSLQVPGVSVPVGTRSLTADDETCIRELDVLVFRVDGAQEKYVTRTHATDFSGTGNAQTFKVSLPRSASGVKHRLVLLANLRGEIDLAHQTTPFDEQDTKEDLLSRITFETSSEWEAALSGSTAFRPLPMWGESASTVEVNSPASAASFGPVKLLRSVARVDVGVNIGLVNGDYVAQGIGDLFKISDIRIHNTNGRGYAAPDAANLDNYGSAGYYSCVEGATAFQGEMNVSEFTYTFSPAADGLIRGIYLAENGLPPSPDEATFFVLGGYYNGASNKTWYRLDLFEKSSQADLTHYELMRNYRYVINITKVNGEGYPSADLAAANQPANLEYEFTYEADDVSDIVYNNQYMLGVSTNLFELGRKAPSNKLVIAADHPDGWSLSVTDSPTPGTGNAPGWMTPTQQTGLGPKDDFVFSVGEYTDNAPREAYIHLSSAHGVLTKTVKVVQTSYEDLLLNISPVGELVFTSGYELGITPQPVQLTWSPTGQPVTVTLHTVSGYAPVTLVGGDPSPVTGSGSAVFYVQPNNMNAGDIASDPSVQYLSRLEFSVIHPNGQQVKKSVSLRQRHTGLSATPKSAYSMIGQLEELTVYSVPGSGWNATLVDGENEVIEELVVSSHASGGQGTLQFRMKEGSEHLLSGTSKVRFTSTDNSFRDVVITIKAFWGYAYSYDLNGSTRNLVAFYQDAPTQRTRPKGVDYCADLPGGWRLPSQDELWGLYQVYSSDLLAARLKPATYFARDNNFLGFVGYNTFNLSNGSRGSTLSFTETHYIRCVRNQ